MLFQGLIMTMSALLVASSLTGTRLSTQASADSTTLPYSSVAADAWIYPDEPQALTVLKRIGRIHAVKAEFLHINDDGSVGQINQSANLPNGYSPEVAATLTAHSDEQFITVSGDMPSTTAAMAHTDQTVKAIASFADKTGFDVELDWEDYGQWDAQYYHSYKQFITTLRAKLHAHHHMLMIDGPPIYDASSQSWYQWKYEELAPMADTVVMMIYDNQYDTGAGNSIAPERWSEQCMRWLKHKTNGNGVAGIAAYGYMAPQGSYSGITVTTSDFIKRKAGDADFSRNEDGELTATKNGIFYDYSDTKTLQIRLKQVEDTGLTRLSVWSLGGNPWFE